MYKITSVERDELATQIDRLIHDNARLQAKLQQQQATAATENNRLLLELIGVVDALDYLDSYLAGNPNPPPVFHQRLPHSIRSISNKLEDVLSSCGVHQIDIPLHAPADFNVCAVVSRDVRSGLAPQSVVKVIRRGFYNIDTVLRSAEIVISIIEPEE